MTTPSLRASATGSASASDGSRSPPRPEAPDVDLRPPPLLEQRTHALLVEEIARLESLLAKTPRKATDRATLVLRLANDYAELAAIAQRERVIKEIEADEARRQLERSERESRTAPVLVPRRPIRM